MSISQLISTLKNISKALLQKKWILYKTGENIVVFIGIYCALAIFHYFVITKPLNLSHKKCKLLELDQYYVRQKHQRLYENIISKPYKMSQKTYGNS